MGREGEKPAKPQLPAAPETRQAQAADPAPGSGPEAPEAALASLPADHADDTAATSAAAAHEAQQHLLHSLWERNLPVLRERLDKLDHAAQLALEGGLSHDEREEACGIAHKLSGSLGMFGYPRGTDLAREMEHILDGEAPITPEEARRLQTLAAELRKELGL